MTGYNQKSAIRFINNILEYENSEIETIEPVTELGVYFGYRCSKDIKNLITRCSRGINNISNILITISKDILVSQNIFCQELSKATDLLYLCDELLADEIDHTHCKIAFLTENQELLKYYKIRAKTVSESLDYDASNNALTFLSCSLQLNKIVKDQLSYLNHKSNDIVTADRLFEISRMIDGSSSFIQKSIAQINCQRSSSVSSPAAVNLKRTIHQLGH